ncbi:hypothetical protein LTR99_002587 [Exophiala xenobiotica]|nr:hypothetical protein LTR96_002829 [Exophiala xenobiotica]KAK5537141.1 hypothetical protein LTR23_007529 [Chaetothyriales sp. CCFEE 6169]KAK5306895.1 hypothetical protein LTR99_002587 [Exophiala xenobiotica]KAK5330345.1 hypothetical protein LTR93_001934 [Exophiala xenobiotica]KAK5417287.1 hypothetical protein LTR06_003274 [Exophiala xenobiotica]
MRFTTLLTTTFAFLAASTQAQDLSSLLSEASSLVGTDTMYQSLLSSAASVLSTATSGLTGDAASAYSSALSAAGSEIAQATSMAGSVTSAAGSAVASATAAAGSAAATASGSSTSTDNGVDRVMLPAMGAMGAAVLGLAAMLVRTVIVDINNKHKTNSIMSTGAKDKVIGVYGFRITLTGARSAAWSSAWNYAQRLVGWCPMEYLPSKDRGHSKFA